MRCCDDGYNTAKRALPSVALAARNCLFVEPDTGEKRAAEVCSWVNIAKLNGLYTQAHLAFVQIAGSHHSEAGVAALEHSLKPHSSPQGRLIHG
jgi:hypothetical protein